MTSRLVLIVALGLMFVPIANAATLLEISTSESGTFGYRYNDVRANRESAFFEFVGEGVDLSLSVSGFDIDQATEVQVFVNGSSVGFLATTANNGIGLSTISIPAQKQVEGSNTLEFRQRVPGWIWGVTDLLLSRAVSGIDISQYNLLFSDEFNAPPGSELESDKWDTAFIWGPYLPINNEEQLYVDTLGMHANFDHSPFELTGSTLKITATPTDLTLQPPVRPPEGSSIWQPRSYTEYRYNGPEGNDPGFQSSTCLVS